MFKLRYNQHFVSLPTIASLYDPNFFIAKRCGGNLLPIKIHKSDDYNLIKHEILFKQLHLLRDNRRGERISNMKKTFESEEKIMKWKLCGAAKHKKS